MSYSGHVKDGIVVLDEQVQLPEGTAVQIDPIENTTEVALLREGLLRMAGAVKGLPSDMARNHDRYIRGASRK